MDGEEALFKVGDRVRWQSQAGGVMKEKVGEIIAEVPEGVPAKSVYEKLPAIYKRPSSFGLPRATASYLIAVKTTEKAKSILYWPVVNRLEKVAPDTPDSDG